MRQPRSWTELVSGALYSAYGVELEHLVDRDASVARWKARDFSPEQVVAEIEPVDLAAARWLSRLEKGTRITYQRALRGLAKRVGSSSIASLLEEAVSTPRIVERKLKRFAADTNLRTGTRRQWITAIRSASTALVDAGLARRSLQADLPHDSDRVMTPVRRQQLDAVDDKLVLHSEDAECLRARCAVLLAYAGLATRELLALTVDDLDLKRGRAQVRGDLVKLDARTVRAIDAWLRIRSTMPGPVFVGLDPQSRAPTTRRVTSRQLQRSLSKHAPGITLVALRRGGILDAADRSWALGVKVARHRRHIGDGVGRLQRGVA